MPSYLFIGGPWDGQRREVDGDVEWGSLEGVPAYTKYDVGWGLCVFVPVETKRADVVASLLENYRPHPSMDEFNAYYEGRHDAARKKEPRQQFRGSVEEAVKQDAVVVDAVDYSDPPAAHPFSNYAAGYANVTKEELIEKMRVAAESTELQPPELSDKTVEDIVRETAEDLVRKYAKKFVAEFNRTAVASVEDAAKPDAPIIRKWSETEMAALDAHVSTLFPSDPERLTEGLRAARSGEALSEEESRAYFRVKK